MGNLLSAISRSRLHLQRESSSGKVDVVWSRDLKMKIMGAARAGR
jgi:hypothetical protein